MQCHILCIFSGSSVFAKHLFKSFSIKRGTSLSLSVICIRRSRIFLKGVQMYNRGFNSLILPHFSEINPHKNKLIWSQRGVKVNTLNSWIHH